MGVLSSITRLELILVGDELDISVLLETPCDEYITDEDNTKTELSEDNAGVLFSTVILELIFMNNELVITVPLETVTDDDIAARDEATAELSEDNAYLL